MRAFLCACLVMLSSWSAAQTPVPDSFDVVSIKRNTVPDSDSRFGLQPGGRWRMVNGSIATLIHAAYPTQLRELTGAPDWVSAERYDVDARTNAADVSREQILRMLRSLLAQRFRLAIRTEDHERPVFALVKARSDGRLPSGVLLSKVDCEAVATARRAGKTLEGPVPGNGAAPCTWSFSGGTSATLRFGGLPLSRLAEALGQPAGRPVIDRTGVAGNFEFTLRYSDDPARVDEVPLLFSALEEQLGLKLVPERAALPVLIVDHIERPTEN